MFSSSRKDTNAIKVVADSINRCSRLHYIIGVQHIPTRRFKRRLQDVARTDRLKQRHLADFSAENQGLSVGGNVRRAIRGNERIQQELQELAPIRSAADRLVTQCCGVKARKKTLDVRHSCKLQISQQ